MASHLAEVPHTLVRSLAAKAGVPKHKYALLWLVRDALSAPIPPGWEACADGTWRNAERGETVKSHPCLSFLRRAVAKAQKEEKAAEESQKPARKPRTAAEKAAALRKETVRLEDGIKLGDAESGGEGYGLRRGGPWLECSELAGGEPVVYWYHFGQRKRLNEHPALWRARRRARAATELQRWGRGLLRVG